MKIIVCLLYTSENTTATSKNLYQAYGRWCEDNTEKPMSAKSFSGYLKAVSYTHLMARYARAQDKKLVELTAEEVDKFKR